MNRLHPDRVQTAGSEGMFRVQILAIALCLVVSHSLVAGTPTATLFEEALDRSAQLNPVLDKDEARKKYAELVTGARSALNLEKEKTGTLTPEQTIAVLNQSLLVNRQVSYISNVYWRDSLFTTAVLERRGNCVSTSLLYHLVAQDLKLPIHLAFAPQHAFVRWDDGTVIFNIETTSKGKAYSDEQVMTQFDLTKEDLRDGGFLQRLTPERQRAALLGNWASVLGSLGQREEASRLLDEALRVDPDNLCFQLQKASADLVEGRVQDAESIFDRLAARKDAGPWARATVASSKARLLTARGKFADAILVLVDVAEIAPVHTKIDILSQLGELYRHLRQFEKAIGCHQLTVNLQPTEDNYNDLGSVLTEAHKDEEAIAAYEAALKLNPENFFTRVILAGLYERHGDKEKGRAFFAQVKQPRDNKVTWHCALVWYYANIKEASKMLENMEASFRLDASGGVYHYFVREPDLDPYRSTLAFEALMKKYAPKPAEKPQ